MDSTTEIAATPRPRVRPFWRIPLAMAAMAGFVLCGIVVSLAAAALRLPGAVAVLASQAAMAAGGVLAVYLLLRLVDRRGWRNVGAGITRSTPLHALCGLGLAIAGTVAVKAVAVTLGFGHWTAPRVDSGIPAAVAIGVALLGIVLSQALPEELVWRGYLYSSLRGRWSQRWSVVAVAVGFGALHVVSNPGVHAALGWRLLYAVMAVGFGFVLAACRVLTGRIWLGVGFHAGFDLTGSLLRVGSYDASLLIATAGLAVLAAALLLVSRARLGRVVASAPDEPIRVEPGGA